MRTEITYYIGCKGQHSINGTIIHESEVIQGVDVDLYSKGQLNILPILRPMSDITSGEVVDLIRAKYGDRRLFINPIQHKLSDSWSYKFYDKHYKTEGAGEIDFDKLSPAQLHILIQQRLDVFNLISSGHAIPTSQAMGENSKPEIKETIWDNVPDVKLKA